MRAFLAAAAVASLAACSTLPDPKFKRYAFPEGVYLHDVKRPHEVIGSVRTKVNFSSLDPNHEDQALCNNYYNKAAQDLLKRARDHGGEAVKNVQSVVFLQDGHSEVHDTPECSDDGEEGQILLQGISIKWRPEHPGQESRRASGAATGGSAGDWVGDSPHDAQPESESSRTQSLSRPRPSGSSESKGTHEPAPIHVPRPNELHSQ